MEPGIFSRERNLYKDQRLIDQRGVKECVTAPIQRLKAAPQVIPPVYRMDRFVADDPLQYVGRRRPRNALHHEETAIEPGVKEMDEIVLDASEDWIIVAEIDEILAHRNECAGPARRLDQFGETAPDAVAPRC